MAGIQQEEEAEEAAGEFKAFSHETSTVASNFEAFLIRSVWLRAKRWVAVHVK